MRVERHALPARLRTEVEPLRRALVEQFGSMREI
jgi:hypothetical protein